MFIYICIRYTNIYICTDGLYVYPHLPINWWFYNWSPVEFLIIPWSSHYLWTLHIISYVDNPHINVHLYIYISNHNLILDHTVFTIYWYQNIIWNKPTNHVLIWGFPEIVYPQLIHLMFGVSMKWTDHPAFGAPPVMERLYVDYDIYTYIG